jgi:hypothetical protein
VLSAVTTVASRPPLHTTPGFVNPQGGNLRTLLFARARASNVFGNMAIFIIRYDWSASFIFGTPTCLHYCSLGLKVRRPNPPDKVRWGIALVILHQGCNSVWLFVSNRLDLHHTPVVFEETLYCAILMECH